MSGPSTGSDVRGSLHPGGVYLTFSGDYNAPYKFAKIVALNGNELWLKLYYADYKEQPGFPPTGEYKVLLVSVDMFLAWGPPKFPIFVADEPVTPAEYEACEDDSPTPTGSE